MKTIGILHKMKAVHENPVKYFLTFGNNEILLNELIGKKIKLEFLHEIYCLGCGNLTKTSFAQGYCYHCFLTHPDTSPCILKPELCEAHLGISRDMIWAKEHCLQEHIVYLALSADVKVGVTRKSKVPTRWIDQGASKVVKLAKTPDRYTAGIIEVALKDYYKDKTDWRKMLKNELISKIDLLEEKQRAWQYLDEDLKEFVIDDDEITEIEYPVNKYPEKVNSYSFDNEAIISGDLAGIKGQYLIFDDERVLNIRKFGGYLIEFEL